MIDVATTGTAPVEYRIDECQRVVYVTMRGTVTFVDLVELLGDVVHDPAYAAGMAVYFDCRILTSIPSHDQIRMLAIDRVLRGSRGVPGRIALVAMTPLGFAFSSALEGFLARPNTEVRVFTSHVKARSWLGIG